MGIGKPSAVLAHADAQYLDEVRFYPQDLEDATLEQGLHSLARGRFPDVNAEFCIK